MALSGEVKAALGGICGTVLRAVPLGLATLAWRMTESTPGQLRGPHHHGDSGIKTLVNFNPLIKLDGYYLSVISQYSQSQEEIVSLYWLSIQTSFGLASASRRVSTRERHIYFLYGLFATVISFSFLGYGVIQMGGFLIESNEPIPLAFFVGLVGQNSAPVLADSLENERPQAATMKILMEVWHLPL